MTKKPKYISLVPKPLLDDFVHGKVVPFVGAGFCKNADIPEGVEMPDWNGLGKRVADEISDYEFENNALDALSYYETLFSRPKLIELLMKELSVGSVQSGDTYKAFCEVFTDVICTTNFDFLLEDAFRNLKRPFSLVATEDRLSIATESETRLIKLHGDFNHPDRMVVTEHDYDVYIENNPVLATYISNLFITKTMFLVGYSLDDYDFRSLWQVVNSRLGKMTRPAYCLLVGASQEKVARYQRRNIKVINLTGNSNEYKTIFREFFIELKDYIDERRELLAKSTDEKINAQLLLPPESNRLCFVSCAMHRIARLKNILYPVLEEMGITPVRIDDMLMLGDNWMDIARTTIRKSNICIVDVSDNNSNVMFELGTIQSEKESDSVMLIAEEGSKIPYVLAGYEIVYYTFDFIDEHSNEYGFTEEVKDFCNKNLIYKKSKNPFSKADKLFHEKEYSACVISAFSELELLIQEDLEEQDLKFSMSTSHIIDLALKKRVSIEDVRFCTSLRNKIVHHNYKAIRNEAKRVLDFVRALIK